MAARGTGPGSGQAMVHVLLDRLRARAPSSGKRVERALPREVRPGLGQVTRSKPTSRRRIATRSPRPSGASDNTRQDQGRDAAWGRDFRSPITVQQHRDPAGAPLLIVELAQVQASTLIAFMAERSSAGRGARDSLVAEAFVSAGPLKERKRSPDFPAVRACPSRTIGRLLRLRRVPDNLARRQRDGWARGGAATLRFRR